jgi:hypothetical protein
MPSQAGFLELNVIANVQILAEQDGFRVNLFNLYWRLFR